jgi:hypothetical protein
MAYLAGIQMSLLGREWNIYCDHDASQRYGNSAGLDNQVDSVMHQDYSSNINRLAAIGVTGCDRVEHLMYRNMLGWVNAQKMSDIRQGVGTGGRTSLKLDE